MMNMSQIAISPFPFGPDNYMMICEVSHQGNYSRRFTLNANGKKLEFDDVTLPDCLKFRWSMINALDDADWHLLKEVEHEVDCYQYFRFLENQIDFKEIGWKVSHSYYVFSLNKKEVSEVTKEPDYN